MSAVVDQGLYKRTLLKTLAEIWGDILKTGNSPEDEAWLYHQMGSIHGQLGNIEEQKKAWEKAKELDPENDMINSSLQSLEL